MGIYVLKNFKADIVKSRIFIFKNKRTLYINYIPMLIKKFMIFFEIYLKTR